MPTRQHSLNSRTSGFIPLGGGAVGRPSGDMADSGIPLTAIKTQSSLRSTGARKVDTLNSAGYGSEKVDDVAHRQHWGRRRRMRESIGRKETGGDDSDNLNFMGRFYQKVVGFSPATRYLVYIVPIGFAFAIPMIVLSMLNHQYDIHVGSQQNEDKTWKNGPPLFKLFEWILITWVTLWAAKVAAWFIPKFFMFFTGIVSVGTKKYATVLVNLNVPLTLFLWALAVWLTFKNFFQPSSEIAWVTNLERVLGATFVSLAVLLGEKAIVQLIGVSYHNRSFANRIKSSKREIRLLSLLYDASRALFPTYCPEFAEEDYVISDSIEMILRGGKKSNGRSTGAATPMKIIGDVGRIGDKVTSAFGHVAQELTGKQVFNPNSAHSVVLGALEKVGPTEALARRIWMSFVVEGRDNLYLDDFQEVLGPSYRDEAEEAFYAIDNDMNGDVSLDEMVRKVLDTGKERKAIGEGMKDIGQALRVFDKILLFVVLLITVFIFLAWFKSSFVTVIATAGTALLSLSFIFAVTAQEFLGSCIFLFVKHPYDVGDRVEINSVQMMIERISLLYTVFTRTDTMQVTQIPNIALNSYWIDNISRSKAMSEDVKVEVCYDTTFEDIELLRLEMEKFVRAPENSRDFKPEFTIGVSSVNALDKLTLNISIKHKSNWHNGVVKATRRSKFMCALALALKKIPINPPGGAADALGGPLNPTYSVAVTDDFASKARTGSAKTKDASRLFPATVQSDSEALASEEYAAAELNTRPPIPETSGLWEPHVDERTVSSEESAPEERQRAREIEMVRADLIKTASQRGRRKAGEGLPGLSPITSTQGGASSSLGQIQSRRLEDFDEESITDMPTTFYHMNRSTTSGAATRLHPSASLRQPGRNPSTKSQAQPPPPPPPAPGQH